MQVTSSSVHAVRLCLRLPYMNRRQNHSSVISETSHIQAKDFERVSIYQAVIL